MEKTVKEKIIKKLKKIGSLTLGYCRSDDEALKNAAMSINKLAHEIYIDIDKDKLSSCTKNCHQ